MESSVLKIRAADRTAVAVIAGPLSNPYPALIEAESMLDDEHFAIALPGGVMADLMRRAEVMAN